MSGPCRATVLTSKAPKTPGPQLWPWPRYSLPVEKAGQRPVEENPAHQPVPSSHQHCTVATGTFNSAGPAPSPRRDSSESRLQKGPAPSTTWGFVPEPRDPPVTVCPVTDDRGNTLDAMTWGDYYYTS